MLHILSVAVHRPGWDDSPVQLIRSFKWYSSNLENSVVLLYSSFSTNQIALMAKNSRNSREALKTILPSPHPTSKLRTLRDWVLNYLSIHFLYPANPIQGRGEWIRSISQEQEPKLSILCLSAVSHKQWGSACIAYWKSIKLSLCRLDSLLMLRERYIFFNVSLF